VRLKVGPQKLQVASFEPEAGLLRVRPAAGKKPARLTKPKAVLLGVKPEPVDVAPKPLILEAIPGAPTPGSVEAARALTIPRIISVKDLAEALGVGPVEVIKELMKNGIMAGINQTIDFDTAAIVASDLGIEVQLAQEQAPLAAVVQEMKKEPVRARRIAEEDRAHLVSRPPVVTVMGHVDHGKTLLLDAIRETNVIATEAGGITQHIGAYQVEKNNQKITFLDTPGHEAFTAMRARGAQVTDIAVLVVAADDGVMPQTLEAMDHARAAQVPIIVALNKIDKESANPERVKQQLSDVGLVVEEWGGDTICVPVSAKKKIGIEALLEMILLVAEMADLRANPNRRATGTIIEAEMDKNKGPLATVLVQNGTLRLNDNVVVGSIFGKIRAMFNDKGKRVRKAEPATPVEILGLTDVPQAGDILEVMADEGSARAIAAQRVEQKQREAATQITPKVTLDELFSQVQAGAVKELNVILKADVQGSIEPIRDSLLRLGNEQVKVKIIHEGTGNVSESDIMLAAASKAIVIGFNSSPDAAAKRQAEAQGVDVREYDIIYNLVDEVNKALTGLLEPKYENVIEGHAEVRATFRLSKGETVAGCMVLDGQVTRASLVKVQRNGETVFDGKVASLRRFKEDVREVSAGYECGIGLEGFNDFKEKDILEAYRKERASVSLS